MATTTNQPPSSPSSSSSQTRTSTQPLHHQSNIPSTSDENVFLFLPNLIGYTRIILAAVSLHFMSYHPIYCTIAYIISQLLDAVDGQVARMLGQTSKFGAVLDMVTDRCTTSCLLCFLSSVYPQWAIMFQSLIALDFASHYIHMYRFVGNELFFVCLYLAHWYAEPLLKGDEYRSLSRSMTRTGRIINSITLPQLIAVLTFPICAGKQIINVVQFWKASKSIVESDLEDRWKARQKKA